MATHEKLMKMRENVYLGEFVDFLKQNGIIHAGAHMPEPVKLKLKIRAGLLMSWFDMLGIVETLNGDAMRGNDISEMCVNFKNKYKNPNERKIIKIGGSDAHTLHTIGRTYTVAPNARTTGEFLEALVNGEVRSEGENGSYEVTKEYILEGVKAYKNMNSGRCTERFRKKEKDGKIQNTCQQYLFQDGLRPKQPAFSNMPTITSKRFWA